MVLIRMTFYCKCLSTNQIEPCSAVRHAQGTTSFRQARSYSRIDPGTWSLKYIVWLSADNRHSPGERGWLCWQRCREELRGSTTSITTQIEMLTDNRIQTICTMCVGDLGIDTNPASRFNTLLTKYNVLLSRLICQIPWCCTPCANYRGLALIMYQTASG